MKTILYVVAIIVIVLLLSCSEQPTRNNPYDLSFDLPEPEISRLDDISLTSKCLCWELRAPARRKLAEELEQIISRGAGAEN